MGLDASVLKVLERQCRALGAQLRDFMSLMTG